MQRFGYDIVKTGVPYIAKTKKAGTVTVGNFPIEMPGYNPQLINYQLYPELNIQLGRLAAAISKKYPGMTVIDVGANVGDTIAVLKSVIDLPVIAVEGDDVSYSFLEKNSQQFSNIYLIKTYLGEHSRVEKVSIEKSGWNTTLIPDDAGEKQISFKTLDEVIALNGLNLKEIKLLKVDVEGFDTIVLRGATGIIQQHKPVLFFEYNRANMIAIKEDGLSTIFSFRNYGYQKIAFFDHKGTLLLATDLLNEEVVTYLHDYASSKNNLVGYFDICIFHETDTTVADEFLKHEKMFL